MQLVYRNATLPCTLAEQRRFHVSLLQDPNNMHIITETGFQKQTTAHSVYDYYIITASLLSDVLLV